MTKILTNEIKEDEGIELGGIPQIHGNESFAPTALGTLTKKSRPVVYAYSEGTLTNAGGATTTLEISTPFVPRHITVDGYIYQSAGLQRVVHQNGWTQWGGDGACNFVWHENAGGYGYGTGDAFMMSGEDAVVAANNNSYALVTKWENNKVTISSTNVAGWVLSGFVRVWS